MKRVQCSFCPRKVLRQKARRVIRCDTCRLARVRKWESEHKATRDTGRWGREHPAAVRATRAAWREKNRAKIRAYDNDRNRRIAAELRTLVAQLPCFSCGARHTPQRRAAILTRLLPATAMEIRAVWPCIWGEPSDVRGARAQVLYRDLRAIGAVSLAGTRYLPAEARSAA